MESTIYDAIIIGGGPGGSTAATYLARAGKRVLLLEKETFPRFHIGESLLPYNRRIFEEMGVLPELMKVGFPRKFGAQFHLSDGSRFTQFIFREGRFTREGEAMQVERAKFDHILLQHAARSGAETREGWTVARFDSRENRVEIEARSPNGQLHNFQGAFLIDASGRTNLTGNQEGIREIHPRLKKLAVFGHFHGVPRQNGERGGDILIVRLADKWFWIIPLDEHKTSVGCVMEKDEYARLKLSPAEVFDRCVRSSSFLTEQMKQARLNGEMHTTTDFSYRNRRFVGHRLIRVGDAAGFMDPIFSAGVYLAMHSGREAAQNVIQALNEKHDGAKLFARYEKDFYSAMERYWELVEHFYTKPFIEVFLSPREKFSIPAAVNAMLAGELSNRWELNWRLRLFYWIVKLQGRWPILPRVSFEKE